MAPDKTVTTFIANAERICAREFEAALRKISRLKWWQGRKARIIAQEAIGIGPFWNKGLEGKP